MKTLIWLMAWIIATSIMAGVCLGKPKHLKASWYDEVSLKREGTWKTSGGLMANGRQFSSDKFTCASRDYPLGTKVKVTRPDTKASVVVLVTDRTAKRFKGKRIDLTPRAFSELAPCSEGLIDVIVERS